MGTKYSHFTLDERCRLRGMMEMGLGSGEIARRLGRHRGTIHREMARNRCASGYRPDSADRMAWVRKLRGLKIQRSTRLRDYVRDRLAMGWSPEEIAGRMELDTMNDTVSAEPIYRYIYSPMGRRTTRSPKRQHPAISGIWRGRLEYGAGMHHRPRHVVGCWSIGERAVPYVFCAFAGGHVR